MTSCVANAHEQSFTSQPPQVVINRSRPLTDDVGQNYIDRRYGVLDRSDTSLTLRLEGETTRTADGRRPTWVLRMTSQPEGYCWGRSDWPSVHCEDQQVRCESATS